MIKRVGYSVARVSFNEYTIEEITRIFLSSHYAEKLGYGLINCELQEELLVSTMLKRNATFIFEYNSQSNELEKKQIFVFNEINFYLDFGRSLLYTIGAQNNLLQIKLLLKKILNSKFEFKNIELTPYKVYDVLTKRKINFSIDEICIENFNHLNGIIGRFNAKVFDNKLGKNTINQYKESCSKILFSLSNDDNEMFKVHVFGNGSFCLISDEESTLYNFDFLKNLIL